MTQTTATQLCHNPKCGADNPLDAVECPKCQTPQRQLLGRGTVLQGRYRIEAVRGCGGFGAVYLATDLKTQRSVAIKENHQHRTFQRFGREAKLLMKLSHPNLPKVHEVFQDPATGRAYLAMDFVDGETLEEFVQRKGALGWEEAEPIFAQIVNALTYLHSQNIVHRDIKPSNVIVTTRIETVYDEVDDWEEAIVPPPMLSESVIKQETDSNRFERGMNYWRDGWRLEDLRRDGWTLSGSCLGGRHGYLLTERRRYRLTLTLSNDGLGNRGCECSDFYRYRRRLCKHLVALLLAWVHEPEAFQVVAEKKERIPIKRKVPRQVNHLHPVLVDFGIAKVMEAVDPKRPRSSSTIAWTDGYSPPEQYLSGQEVDGRADQYALAATMVFALTGQKPFDASTRMEKYSKGEPDLPSKPSDVPDHVWRAIQKAMEFDSQKRFESVDEFWKTLQTQLPISMPIEKPQKQDKVKSAVRGAILGAILFATLGAIGGASEGAIGGAILFAIYGAIEAIKGR